MTRQHKEFKKGDVVEGYRVLQELGRGAASVIYVVQDPKSKQVWALKHVEKVDPKDVRFLEQADMEYTIARELDHPGIRKIERVIKKKQMLVTTTELYVVMELVDGVSLDVSPPRTFESAVSIFQQVAEALHSMHTKGYVHADMKPNNIVVYNLGATMYYLLTRTKVPTALADGNSLVSRLDDNLIERPKPAIELNPRLNPRLNDLIMQCVEINAEDRPTDMKMIADRLNLILGLLRAKNQGPVASESPTDND